MKTGIVCPNCGWDDSRKFVKVKGYTTYVCPNCANSWTKEDKNVSEG